MDNPGMTNDDVAAVTAIVADMSRAWNEADAAAFASAFADDAEFVAFEGTILPGHDAIVAYHQPLFDTLLKGSVLSPADIHFARIVNTDTAVVHNRVSVTMPGEDGPSPSRDSMQLFVLHRTAERWTVASMQNSRIISLERQQLLDAMDALAPDVVDRVEALLADATGTA